MGSAESTGRSNGDNKDEGTPNLGAPAVAIGGAAVAAWAVKKMLFDNKGGEEMNGFEPTFNGTSSSPPPGRFNGSGGGSASMGTATAVAIAAAGTAMATWGISRMISNSENNSSGGGSASMGTATAVAIAAAGTAMAAWGISRMISNSESKEKDNPMKIKAHETESSFPNLHIYESKETTAIWSPPPAGGLKMNTDATCKGKKQSDGVERGPSWFGGILRNDRGEWVRGFLGFIDDNIENLVAEIYSINGGLKLLDKDDQYRGSFLENDHQEAVNWINGKYDYKPKPQVIKDCWNIIEKSRQLARKNNITIGHVVREANDCADRLADMAVYTRKKYLILENRPDHDDVFERRYKQDLRGCLPKSLNKRRLK